MRRGNRLTIDSASCTYDSDNKLTASPGGYSYGYDLDGNMTSKTVGSSVTSYTYNLDNNLTQVTLPSARVIGFTYDSDGTRIARTDGTSTTKKYIYSTAGLVQELNASGTTTMSYNPGISQSNGTSTTFFQPDHLGSTVATSSDTFTPGYQGYDAWGNTLYQTGQTTPFGFVGAKGYYTDEGTGLMKLGCRYYDPTVGRFITKDPSRDGWNWYAYAGNNPLNGVDATGMKRESLSSLQNAYVKRAITYIEHSSNFSNYAPWVKHMYKAGRIAYDSEQEGGLTSWGIGGYIDLGGMYSADGLRGMSEFQGTLMMAKTLVHEQTHVNQGPWKIFYQKGRCELDAYNNGLDFIGGVEASLLSYNSGRDFWTGNILQRGARLAEARSLWGSYQGDAASALGGWNLQSQLHGNWAISEWSAR